MSNQDDINKNDIAWIKDSQARIEEQIKDSLARIEEQTTSMNQRVSYLEEFKVKATTYGTVVVFIVPYLIVRFL